MRDRLAEHKIPLCAVQLRVEGVEGKEIRGGDWLRGQESQVDWCDGPRVIFLKNLLKPTARGSSAARLLLNPLGNMPPEITGSCFIPIGATPAN